MKQLWWWLSSVMVVSMLAACGQQESASLADSASPAPASAKMAADRVLGGAAQSMTELSEPATAQPNAELKKYVALRHHLNVEVPAETMQASFEAAVQHCEALRCQILNASIQRATDYSPPYAQLSARIPPRNVAIFMAGLAKSGDIVQHGREAEDKTNQVVDTDARIKNLSDLRDRLRLMLTNKQAQFKDIIEVERELANTQSQLDSLASMRKLLALETELVAVNIDFSAKQGITQQGFFAPVALALADAGRVMMASLATLISFIASAIPWLLIGIPLLLLVRAGWLALRKKWSSR